MIDKLEEVERKFERLTADLSNPDIISDRCGARIWGCRKVSGDKIKPWTAKDLPQIGMRLDSVPLDIALLLRVVDGPKEALEMARNIPKTLSMRRQ